MVQLIAENVQHNGTGFRKLEKYVCDARVLLARKKRALLITIHNHKVFNLVNRNNGGFLYQFVCVCEGELAVLCISVVV